MRGKLGNQKYIYTYIYILSKVKIAYTNFGKKKLLSLKIHSNMQFWKDKKKKKASLKTYPITSRFYKPSCEKNQKQRKSMEVKK